MDEKKELFETVPIPRALTALAVPTIISQLITMIYNLADTYFIGMTDDPLKVAAASLAYTLFFIMNALSNLFGIGGGSLISRLLGKQQRSEASTVGAFSFYGTIIVAALYSLGCFVFMEPLLYLLGATDNTLEYAASYTLWVVVVGGIPSTLGMTLAHLLRSEGYSKQAGFGLGMGGVLNILLDPLFMFVLLPAGSEVTGAAIATMLSNLVAMCYFALVYLRLRGSTVMSVSPADAKRGVSFCREIFSVGFPSALGSLLSCVSNIVVNKLSSGYGDLPVAAMGIVKKIDMLPMNVGMGLCQGMLPLVAYNYASGDHKRMKSAMSCARIAGMGFAAVCIVIFELLSGQLVELFIGDAETVALGRDFLRIACLATPFMISNFQMSYTFQALGRGTESLLLSSCRQGIVNIPLLFLNNYLFGLFGIIWTQLVSDLITLVLSVLMYRRVNRKLKGSAATRR